MQEAKEVARTLLKHQIPVEAVFTSALKRTIQTAKIILEEMGQISVPFTSSWRLNERMYGALEGMNKAETQKK
jgi:bisphosphoglycerate-dependent phosphoglycerate mutase family 1